MSDGPVLSDAVRERLAKLSPERRALLEQKLGLQGASASAIEPRADRSWAPLGAMPRFVWLLTQATPGLYAYNAPRAYRIRGALDLDALQQALDGVVARHEVFRSRIVDHGGEARFEIDPPRAVPIARRDLAHLHGSEQEGELHRALGEAARVPFDLRGGMLLRATLFTLGADDHVLLLVSHHIASDGASRNILNRELGELYAAAHAGRPSALEPVALQFGDYAAWQERELERPAVQRQVAFWREHLADAPDSLDLPVDRPRALASTFEGMRRKATVPLETVARLERAAESANASLFMVLLAAHAVLLARLTGQDDVVIGIPVAGRSRPELDGVMGYLTNTLPIRLRATREMRFSEMVDQVRTRCLEAFENQDVPFELLAEEVQRGRMGTQAPIFQSLFTLHDQNPVELRLAGLELEPLAFETGWSKLEFGLDTARNAEGSLDVIVSLRADLFTKATLALMTERVTALLGSIAADVDSTVGALTLLSSAERGLLTRMQRGPAVAFPEDRTVSQLVEAQVARTPNAVAVRHRTDELTYAELDQRAEMLAAELREQGVGAGKLVGICISRSLDLMVAVLGVWKAGGCYLPLDPGHPADRIALIVADSGVTWILTDAEAASVLPAPGDGGGVYPTRSGGVACWKRRDPGAAPIDAVSGARSLAYVIYTSGSTGTPKGVEVEHRSVVNFLSGLATRIPVDSASVFVAVTPLTFDISVLELWHPLVNGSRVILASDRAAADPYALGSLIAASGATHLQSTPSAWRMLVESGWRGFPGFVALCGGEAMSEALAAALLERGVVVWNLYGPTEATIWATWHRVDGTDGRVAIGTPMPNVRAYVLDDRHEVAPIGVPGALHLAGDCLARGYRGRPDLTTERFVADPFVPGQRMYQTGDRARWRTDGTLDYLGRTDFQVKLRGHRIELGEIESVLMQVPGVSAVVVMAREDRPGEERLVAYLVGRDVDAGAARTYTQRRLPDIMVPSTFVLLDRLPLNTNGKTDRRALPAPSGDAFQVNTTFVAPRTPLERDIAAAWCSVLHLDQVGVHDDFFAMGGHSLAAMRIMARLAPRLPTGLSLGAVLGARTVAALAELVEALPAPAPAGRIEPRVGGGPAPLSHAQQLVWLFEQMTPGTATYNVPIVRRVSGALDFGALERALSLVVARHEILHTRFEEMDGVVVQYPAPPATVRVAVVDLRQAPDRDTAARRILEQEATRPFDLRTDVLLRATAVRTGDHETLLLLVAHHVAFDGGSIGVLMRDLGTCYDHETGASDAVPGPLPIQFADYAAWERDPAREPLIEQAVSYWREQLVDAPGTIDLPTDRPRSAAPSGPGARHVTVFSPDLTVALRALAQDQNATLFMVLLAGFQALLHRYSGQRDLVVGTAIAGRLHAETQDLIGYFANTLALRARFEGDVSFTEHLGNVRRSCLEAYEHQSVPYERIVLDLRPKRPASDAGLFSVMLVLQDADSAPLHLRSCEVRPEPVELGTAKFDLSLSMTETPRGLRLSTEFRSDLFDAETIDRLAAHFETLLRAAVATPAEPVSSLAFLTADDEAALSEWSRIRTRSAACLPVHTRFERWAMTQPDRVAVTFEDKSVTYGELNRRANRLAHELRAAGAGPDRLVAICLERSVDLVVAILGVLKSGAGYLPLDPSYPAERLAFMLADAAPLIVITTSELVRRVPRSGATAVLMDQRPTGGDDAWERDPCWDVREQHLAYVIYTSGSTGRPKGVMVTHRNVGRLFDSTYAWFGFDENDVWTLFHSYAFDFSVWELWGALAYGGRLVVVPYVVSRSPATFLELLRTEEVTVLNQTPSAFRPLMAAAVEIAAPLALRCVIFGGEALEPATLRPWLATYGEDRPRLINMYGITETTVHVTYRPIGWREVRSGQGSVIGQPIPDLSLQLLDARGQRVPVGVPGEVHVGGDGVARGYLNRPELTAQRFIPDQFGDAPAGRLYRSGDLARWRRDGDLEYLGRIDDQVKLRGFRIELGEIESAIAAHPGIQESIVLFADDRGRGKRLVGYYTSRGTTPPTAAELRAFLLARLPDYMVPSAWQRLDAFPLTQNGKVDRTALPAPDAAGADESAPFVAPKGSLEAVIAAVWAEVLGVPRISAEADFFSLGGHSLLATQVVARVARLLRIRTTLRMFFDHPTVRGLAGALAASATDAGQLEKIAAAVLRLREMSPAERDGLRAGAGRS